MIAPYVDPQWLADHPEAVLADVRWYADGRSARQAYERGHLPGAVFVPLEEALAAPASNTEGRHPLPAPESFAAALGTLGIGDDDVVVGYDDEAGAMAARLVWMLRAIGRDAALLDGGLTAWDGPLEEGAVRRPPVVRDVVPWPPGRLAGIDEVTGALLVDARQPERWRGELEPLDLVPGHVPGAVNVSCRHNVGPDGRLLPDAVLRERFAAITGPWVSSCGSGVTACQNLLVAEHLGLPQGRLWPGSYSQWTRQGRPVETAGA